MSGYEEEAGAAPRFRWPFIPAVSEHAREALQERWGVQVAREYWLSAAAAILNREALLIAQGEGDTEIYVVGLGFRWVNVAWAPEQAVITTVLAPPVRYEPVPALAPSPPPQPPQIRRLRVLRLYSTREPWDAP
jgi:hypothetical protein